MKCLECDQALDVFFVDFIITFLFQFNVLKRICLNNKHLLIIFSKFFEKKLVINELEKPIFKNKILFDLISTKKVEVVLRNHRWNHR